MRKHYQAYILFAFLLTFPFANAIGQCTADAGQDKTICNGSSTPIGSTAITGYTYLWSPTTGLNNPSSSNPNANPTVTTTYTVTANNGIGGSCTDDVVIMVIDPPTANAGNNQAMCEGDTLIIGSAAQPGVNYFWTPAVRISSTTVAQPKVYPTSSITYTLTATNGAGCSAQSNIQITVLPVPVAYAGNDVNYCRGQAAIQIGFNSIPTFSYQWSPPTGLSDPTAAQPFASPFNSTSYTVIVTSAAGCTASDQVIVNSYDVPTADAGPDKNICPGQTTQIGSANVVTYSYAWSPTTNMSNPSSSSPTVGPTVTTTYTVTVTGSGGCQNYKAVIVYVGNPPALDAGPNRSICANSNTVIGTAAIPNVNYSWSPTGTLSNPNIAQPTATPTVTTTYILTATGTINGCSAIDSVIINTNPLPIANAGRDTAFCVSGTASLGSSGVNGMSYNWNPTTGLSSSTAPNPTANPANTTTYTVTVTNTSSNCTAKDQVIVTVNPLPIASAGGDRPICAGKNTILGSASVLGQNYSWNPITNLSASNISNPTATPTATITYTVTVTNSASGCTASDDVVVTVNVNPTINPAQDESICIGGSIQIGNPATAGYSYSWSPTSNLTPNSTTANPTASPTITTTYIVTVTNGFLCTATDDAIVTVNPLPNANAGLDRSICMGQSTQIGAATTAGYSYLWNNAGTLSSTGISNPTATPTTTTTYTVTVTNNATTCSASDKVVVTILPAPIANAGTDQTICSGASIGIGSATIANMSYSWNPTSNLSASNNSNPIASPATTTTYTVLVTDNTNGCTASDAVIINVNPKPAANAGADKIICAGQTIPIGSAGSGSNIYSWNPTTGLSNGSSPNPNASPTTTTTYTVLVTDGGNGCTASDNVVVTVNPTPNAVAGPDQTICSGQNAVLGTALTVGYNYNWNPATNLSSTTSSNPTATPIATITYTVTVTNGSTGCTASDNVIITVNTKPSVNAGPDKIICSGSSVQIGNPATAGFNYSWTPTSGLSSGLASNPTASPTITTTYIVTITDNTTGCTGSDDVIVKVNALPNANAGLDRAICKGQSTIIGAATTAGYNYQWDNGGTLSSTNVSNPTATPTTTTTYSVTVTNGASACSAIDNVVVTVNPNVTANAGLNQTTCSGVGVSIGSGTVAGMSYSWNPTTALSASNISSPIASPITTTTYSVTVTNTSTGCSAFDAVVITVNPNPVANAGLDKSICEGQTTSIGSALVAGMGYSWSPTSNLSNSSAPNPSANPTTTTTYTVVVTNLSTGCSASDNVVVTVNPLPTANAGADRTICNGQSTVLGAAATAGFSYSWNPTANLNSSTNAAPKATPSVTVTYTITVTNDASGCTATDDVVVTVNPVPTANAGVDQTVCQNSPISIGSAPVGGVTYSWSPTTGLSNPNASNPTATPTTTATITYTLTVSFIATGCSSSDAMVLTVNPQPVANAGLDKSFCTNAGAVTIGTPGSATNSYSWSPTADLSNPLIATPVANPSVTTTYTVTVQNNTTGCTATDDMILSVYTPPTAFAGADITQCSDDKPVQIGGPSSANETYQWTPTQGLNAANISNPKAGPTATITYTLTVKNTITTCSATDDITITINPSPTFNMGGNKNFCLNSTQQIGVTPNANYSYQWTPTTGLSDPTIGNPTATLTANVTYTLKVTDINNGCVKIDSVKYKVGPAPVYSAGRDTAICRGKTVRLGAGNPPANCSFKWSPAQTLDNPSIAVPIATPLATTSYVITVTDLTYGCVVTDEVVVTAIAPPPSMAGTDQTICVGQKALLGNANDPTYTYKWTPAATLNKDDIAQPTASPTITTSYTLQLTNTAFGCIAKDTVLVTVNSLPGIALTHAQTMCSNVPKAIGVASNAGYSYSWTPVTGLNDPTISNPLASPAANTTYVLLVTDNTTSCIGKDSVMLAVITAPAIQPSPDMTLCNGDSVTIGFAGSASYTYTWSPSAGLKNSKSANTIAKPIVTTTYSLIVTDAAKTCPAWDTVIVTVNPVPVIEAGNNNHYCKGTVVLLGVLGNQQYKCVWTPATGLNNATAAQPSFTVTADVTYILTATDSVTGCPTKDTVVIKAVDYPVINAGTDRVLCQGSSTQLGSINNLSYKYSWSPGNGMADSTKATPTVNPTVTTSYILTAIDTSGICATQDTVTIQVFTPTVSAGTAKTICLNSTVQIGSAPINGYTYSWSPTAGLSNSFMANPLASPQNTTTYVLAATDGQYGCVRKDSVIVKVNKILLSSAGRDTAICLGEKVTLGLATNKPNYSYNWTPNAFLNNNKRPNPICFPQGNPPASITYIVTIRDLNTGCSMQDTVVVTINRINKINAGSDVTICPGGSVTLGSGLPNNPYSYTWQPGKTLNDSLIKKPVATPTLTTKYTVVAKDANGCTANASMTVNIINANVTFPAGYKICLNANVYLNPKADFSYQYIWSPAATLNNATAPNPLASPTITTTYTVKAYKLSTQGDTCSTMSTMVVDVATKPLALKASKDTTACKLNPLKLYASTSSSGSRFYWYSDSLNTAPINANTTDSIITVTPKYPTTYYIKVVNDYCETIDSIKVKLDSVVISTIGCEICKGDIGLLRGINNSGKQLSYLWSPNTDLQGNVTDKAIKANPTVTTTYTLTATDSVRCYTKVDAIVKVRTMPAIKAQADKYSIMQGESVQLLAQPGNLQGYSYEWTPRQVVNTPDNSYTDAKPKKTTTYYITIKEQSAAQCTASDSLVIQVIHIDVCGEPDIFVANAFTPNGDGNNDYVYVRGAHIIKNFSFTIYNRWGQKMFETTNIEDGWDGTLQGESCNEDVYIYFLKGFCKDNVPFAKKGNITLLK